MTLAFPHTNARSSLRRRLDRHDWLSRGSIKNRLLSKSDFASRRRTIQEHLPITCELQRSVVSTNGSADRDAVQLSITGQHAHGEVHRIARLHRMFAAKNAHDFRVHLSPRRSWHSCFHLQHLTPSPAHETRHRVVPVCIATAATPQRASLSPLLAKCNGQSVLDPRIAHFEGRRSARPLTAWQTVIPNDYRTVSPGTESRKHGRGPPMTESDDCTTKLLTCAGAGRNGL